MRNGPLADRGHLDRGPHAAAGRAHLAPDLDPAGALARDHQRQPPGGQRGLGLAVLLAQAGVEDVLARPVGHVVELELGHRLDPLVVEEQALGLVQRLGLRLEAEPEGVGGPGLEAELGDVDAAPLGHPLVLLGQRQEPVGAAEVGHRHRRLGLAGGEHRAPRVLVVRVHRKPADGQLAGLRAALGGLDGPLVGTPAAVQAQRREQRVARRADGRGLAEQHVLGPARIACPDRAVAGEVQLAQLLAAHVHDARAGLLALGQQVVLQVGLVPQRVERRLAAVAAGHGTHELPEQGRVRLPVAGQPQLELVAHRVRAARWLERGPVGHRRPDADDDLEPVRPGPLDRLVVGPPVVPAVLVVGGDEVGRGHVLRRDRRGGPPPRDVHAHGVGAQGLGLAQRGVGVTLGQAQEHGAVLDHRHLGAAGAPPGPVRWPPPTSHERRGECQAANPCHGQCSKLAQRDARPERSGCARVKASRGT